MFLLGSGIRWGIVKLDGRNNAAEAKGMGNSAGFYGKVCTVIWEIEEMGGG